CSHTCRKHRSRCKSIFLHNTGSLLSNPTFWFFDLFGHVARRAPQSGIRDITPAAAYAATVGHHVFDVLFKESSAGAMAHRSRGWRLAQPSAMLDQKTSGSMGLSIILGRSCHVKHHSMCDTCFTVASNFVGGGLSW